MHFLIRALITAAALWTAVHFLPGITYTGNPVGLVGVAVVFGVVNAVIRPILALLTCPLVLLTLGLFVFVLNAAMLWLTARISVELGLDFRIENFLAALVGALIVGIVSTALNIVVGPKK